MNCQSKKMMDLGFDYKLIRKLIFTGRFHDFCILSVSVV